MNPKLLYNRHNEVALLHSRQRTIEATEYNEAQTALKQFGQQIRFSIPKLKYLDLILQKNAWIVVDRALNDFPVLAWTDFNTTNRSSLQAPVICEQRVFHFAANLIQNRTLDAMSLMLGERLAKAVKPDRADVIPLNR